MTLPNFQSRNSPRGWKMQHRNKLMVTCAVILMCMMWTANVDTDIFKLKTNYNLTTAAANSAKNRERTTDNILLNWEQDSKQEFKEVREDIDIYISLSVFLRLFTHNSLKHDTHVLNQFQIAPIPDLFLFIKIWWFFTWNFIINLIITILRSW